MWKYIRKYLPYTVFAAIFMLIEVTIDLFQPTLMSKIIDEGVLGINNNGIGDLSLIISLGLTMILLVIFGCFGGTMNNVFVNIAGQNIGNNMRKDAFKKIMSLSFKQIDNFSTGSLVTRITNDISQVERYISQFARGMIRTVMLTLGSIFFMFRLNHEFGIIMLCAFPFIMGCMLFCIKKASPLFSKLQLELDRINEIMQEDISGIRIIKACVRETYEKIRFKKANNNLIKTQLKTLVIFAFMNPIMNFLMYMVIVFIIWIGSKEVGSNITSPGVIIASITYCTQLLHGILMLVMLLQNISRGTASWKRVKEILDSAPELIDGDFSGKTTETGTIEFKNVDFKYQDGHSLILKNINLKINQGETIAIMGATGCGKSTLVNLIPRFYDVTSGEILVDGINVKDYKLSKLRDKVSITLQKSELFSETIKENILWGKGKSTEEEIKKAAIIAQADSFINEKEEKYNAFIAERGMSLSGGQKQRLSITRSILKNSEILIFDDSTSALDLKTERALYKDLKEAYPNTTKIIIAQRVATVRNVDKIIVLENGSIVDIGNHKELMKQCKVYQDIYYSQSGKEGENNE